MRRSIQALMVILLTALMIGGAVSPALASSNRASGSLRWVYMSGSATGGKLISVRVTLWDVAPAGGALVFLSSSNPVVKVPATVTVSAGESEVVVRFRTVAVTENTPVVVQARQGDRVRQTRTVVLRPYLSSTTVQSRIRSGGFGKVIVRLSGIAPEGGVTVKMHSNRPSILPVPATVYFPAGKTSVSINVPAAKVSRDVPINVAAFYRGVKITRPTIVRKYGITGTGEPTASATATATETGDDESTATATASPDATATAEAVLTATQRADDATATQTSMDETATSVSIEQTATMAAEQTATQTSNDQTATRTGDDATATQQAIDATATQSSVDQTATQVSIDQTATQVLVDQTATQTAVDQTATQAAIEATATQMAMDETATQTALDGTATQAAVDATATQSAADATATQGAVDMTATETAADATATQIAIDEAGNDVTICHSNGNGTYNGLTLSLSGVLSGHLGSDNGEHGGLAGDIIPPFDFRGETHQQNWDEAGQAIYYNDCQAVVALNEDAGSQSDGNGEQTQTIASGPQSLEVSVSTLIAPKGGTVWYTICLTEATTSDVTISWYPAQPQFDAVENSGSITIPQGSVDESLCTLVAFSGFNRGGGAPTGNGYLIFAVDDGQFFSGPEVRFEGKG